MISVHRLEQPSESQVDEIVQLLLKAYDGQPMVRIMTDSNKEIEAKWHRLGTLAGALEGRIWVVYDPSGLNTAENAEIKQRIVSVVIGFGPGVLPMASEAQRALGLAEYMSLLSEENKKWQNETFHPLVKGLIDEAFGNETVLGSWIPILLATDPQHQRKGYASALLQKMKDTAKEDDTMVVLFTHTDALENYYMNQGFTVEGRVEIPSPLGSWVHRALLWDSDSAR